MAARVVVVWILLPTSTTATVQHTAIVGIVITPPSWSPSAVARAVLGNALYSHQNGHSSCQAQTLLVI